MKSLRLGVAITWGALAGTLAGMGCGCAPELESGATVSELTRENSELAREKDAVQAATDPDFTGAAGQGAPEPEPEPEPDGSIFGLGGDGLTGSVSFAAGSLWSGEIAVSCCREGSYSVYVYEGGRCDDEQSWDVERSARVADLSCANDVGSAAYARDPSEATRAAFVIYDAAGSALGCADVSTDLPE